MPLGAKAFDPKDVKRLIKCRYGLAILGRIDHLVRFDDGGWGVIDYKTTIHDEVNARKYARQLHAYAWALFRAGKVELAAAAIERARETGLRDAELLYHAAVIAEANGDRHNAAKLLRDSLELNRTSAVAEDVLALRN